MKKVAIVQSNYIPWKGYFELIAAVDEFILYDDMQYTRRDWRNRNLIKTPRGVEWLTIPVKAKGNFHAKIREIETERPDWPALHWSVLSHNYASAPFFAETAEWLRPLYEGISTVNLSEINRIFITAACRRLGISTAIKNSWDYQLIEGKSERLADLCAQAGADLYISGPAARGYLEEEAFRRIGIEVRWFNYDGQPEYPQLWGPFTHKVSVLDLLFNTGGNARSYLRQI